MPDPTETPPVEGNEPVVPPVESPILPPETPPAEPPAETPPKPISEEEILHKTQSWTGRRLVELKDEIIRAVREMIPAGGSPPPAEAPDPSQDADAWFEHKLKEKVTHEQEYNQKLITTGTALISQDEVVKANPEMAEEIYQEIQSGRVPIMRNVAPEMAAQIAVAQAKSNVLTKRIMTKANPLAGNTPANVPTGGVTPPAAPAAPAVKVPKLSNLAAAAAKKWGMSNEEVAKALAE